MYHTKYKRGVLNELYETVLRAMRSYDWIVLDSEEDLKATVIAALLRAKRMGYSDIQHIIEKVNVRLTREEYIRCQEFFAKRGYPTVLLAIDCLKVGKFILVGACDGEGDYKMAELCRSEKEAEAFMSSDLFGYIRDGTMGWPESWRVEVMPGVFVKLPSCVQIDEQMMLDLVLDHRTKVHIKSDVPWVRGSCTAQPTAFEMTEDDDVGLGPD